MAHCDSIRLDLGSAEPLLYRCCHQGQPAETASSSRSANLSTRQHAAAACPGHMTHAPPEPDCLGAARQGTLHRECGLAMTALLKPNKLTQDTGVALLLWSPICHDRLECRKPFDSIMSYAFVLQQPIASQQNLAVSTRPYYKQLARFGKRSVPRLCMLLSMQSGSQILLVACLPRPTPKKWRLVIQCQHDKTHTNQLYMLPIAT